MTIYPKPLGELKIYKEENETGQKIIKSMDEKSNPIILIAQPQQGKTNCIIVFIHHLIEHSKLTNERTEILWITSQPNNSLLKQTKERLEQAGIDPDKHIKVIHRSGLKKLKVDDTCNRRIIINDECHIAINKDGEFNRFLENLGIYIGKPRSQWDDDKTFLVLISATPFPHKIIELLDKQNKVSESEKRFQEIIMDESPDYYSIEKMFNANRFKQSGHLLNKNTETPTKFFHEVFSEFENYCNKNGPKHLIVRTKNNDYIATLVSAINKYYPDFRIKEFSTNKKNIVYLSNFIQKKYPNPYIVIIRGAMRVGETIQTTSNIGGWVETNDSNPDTTAQAIRCLGYEMVVDENGNTFNRRFKDDFPFYTNMSAIEKVIEFYRNPTRVPSSKNNSSIIYNRKYHQFIFDTRPTLEQALTRIKNANLDPSIFNFNGLIKHAVMDNNKHNIADNVLRNEGYSQQQTTSGKLNLYHIDGPHPKYQKDYDLLIEKRPEFKNKFILVYWDGKGEVGKVTECHIKENTYFS